MKPATDPQENGVIETTTRRRVIPASDLQDSKTPDLWDYLRTIGHADWPRHIVYGYRIEPAPKVPIFKCTEPIVVMPNGQRIPIADEEELEFALLQNFGGGVFRLLVKKGPMMVTAGNLAINAPPRAITIPIDTGQPTGNNGSTMMSGDTAQIANKAIDTIAGAEHQAVRIGIDALSSAANIMRTMGEGRPQAGDDLMRQFMAVMMQRMLQPPPDPLDLLTKLLALQAQLNPGRTQDETTAAIMKTALDRLLNPAPAGSPVNTGTALVQMLPALGNQFVEGIREFAKVRESEARIIAIQRGAPMPPGVNPQVLPPVPPNGAPPNGAQPPANGGAPSVEFIDRKIVEFLKAPNLSVEQAADEVMAFLETLNPDAVTQLAGLGETRLLQLFTERPILREACNNMPRLVEFIRAFLRMHAEDVAAEHAQAVTPPPAKPLPN